jgi:uncharacterized protein YcfJ
MKKTLLSLALIPALGLPAGAAFAESFTDNARVLSVNALTERIPVSREECWNDRQRSYEERRVTRSDTGASIGAGTVLGAVVGGVIGHQFGSSSGGRDRGTAAGAIVGGLVGNQVDRGNAGPSRETVEVERVPVERNVERCRTVNEVREATLGYDVRYEYRGRQFATRMPHDPGRNLQVRVDVTPVEGAYEPGPGPRPGPRPPSYTR